MDPAARLLRDAPAGRGRVLVVVAHPDDEVLGCGGLLARLPTARVVHVTDGAPRDAADARRHGFAGPADYAAARAAEAEAALALAGHPAACLRRLGVPDQEAAGQLVAIARGLVAEVAAADWVLTHAYEGGHPDHDAVAFATAAALRLAGRADAAIEMPFYHAVLPAEPPDASGWTRQRFLPQAGAGPEHVMALDAAAQAGKRAMVAAHRSQAGTLRAFALDRERFRRAPAYDFAALPHGGDLLSERHGWKLTGAAWCAAVRAAEAALGAPPR